MLLVSEFQPVRERNGDRLRLSADLPLGDRQDFLHVVAGDRKSDPDDTRELRRLHNAADVMRRLARRFISLELCVSDSPFPIAGEADEQAL